MSNRYFRLICFLIIIIIFTYAFYDSYASHNIDKLAYVIALGIDSSETDNIKVTFQFAKSSTISEQNSSDQPITIENSIDASSIDTAINIMNAYMGKELSLSHCKIIVFSEKFAKNGLSTQIYSLINNEEIRPSTNIIISKCTAKDYISNAKPLLDKLPTRYYETFFQSSGFTGFTADLTIGEFYNKLVCSTCNPTAILGYIEPNNDKKESDNSSSTINNQNINIKAALDNSNNNSDSEVNSNTTPDKTSISNQETTKNFGIAVFNQDVLIGELTSLETVAHLLIDNQLDTFMISIKNPTIPDSFIDLSISQFKKTKISSSIINGSPYITIELFLTGKILTLDESTNYTTNESLEAIDSNCNLYLENLLYSYLYKTAKEFKSDIDGFGKFTLKSFITNDEWQNYNWYTKYKDSNFKVKINFKIQSSMLLTNS